MKIQARRINHLCRSNNPASVFFWSEVWGGEACFISDFGESFEYKKDPPHEKEMATISFPSLDHVLSRRFVDLSSRHFPLSKTYVKFRLLSILRYK